MPVINGVYLKDFPALPSSVADANIIPIAIAGNQIAYKTTVSGIITDARITGKLLTGLSVTGGAVVATDTILEAFGKVQNQLNSKVTSVGLSMPSAFTVTNSPVTGSGTLTVTGAGLASQYIRGDGALADFPTGGGGGGSSVSYYLNGSVNQGTFVGNTYYEMNKTPIFGAGTDFSTAADGYIAQFITDANDPNSLLIPAGNWNLEFYFSASSGGGTPTFYAELYKYDGTTFTLIADNSTNPELIAFGTTIAPYFSPLAVPETVLLATDRLAIRVYVANSGRTITLHTENSNLSQVITTFTTGLQSLNGLTKQTQYFAVGSTGTDFTIVSSVDTHTFNIPDASATARGFMSIGTQTIAGSKIFSNDIRINTINIGLGGGAVITNTRVGVSALSVNTSGDFNTANGYYSLFSNTSGNSNTANGTVTIANNTTGSFNTAYGSSAGSINTTGSNNIFLGYNSTGESATESNRTWIGNTDTTSTWVGGNLLLGTRTNATSDKLQVTGSAKITGQLTLASTITNGTYTYTLPAATGTLALTSDLSGYLPLTGGTLTGALSGTSATFTGSVTSDDLILTAGTLFGAGNTGFSNRLSDTTLYLQMPASGFNVTDNALNTKFSLSSTGAATFSSGATFGGIVAIPNNSYFTFRNAANTAYRAALHFNSSNKLFLGVDTDITSVGIGTTSEQLTITSAGYTWVNGAISGYSASGVQMQVNGQTRFGGLIILHNGSNSAETVSLSCTAASTVTISDNVVIVGSLSKGSGSFRIEHPLPSLSETHQLVHSFVEAPQADLYYRGKMKLVDGKGQANIDEIATMTEGTFEVLCREVQCFTTNESGWDLVRGKVIGNIIYLESQNEKSTDEISWLVIGERKDKHIMETDWTDENGKVIVEPLKPIQQEPIEDLTEVVDPIVVEELTEESEPTEEDTQTQPNN